MDKVLYLSGTTRGATLENIGRSLGRDFGELGLGFIEVSLLDHEHLLENLKRVNFQEVRLIYSWVSMGLDIKLRQQDGSDVELWKELGVPFVTFHGDSPAYFFDRHIVPDSKFVSFYGFDEHRDLRKRLPHVNGPIDILWPLLLDEIPIEQLNFEEKKNGKILFLKNGKDPARLRRLWASCLEPRLLQAIHDLASELERDLDNPVNTQIDDLIVRYFNDQGFDIESLLKLRLFFIAQLDDYLRAVKCTRMAEALMDLPVEIRGNNWEHLDFTGKKATYIDECDYSKSVGLIRESLGLIDVSPNTVTRPHDRLMRAYGAHTFCLTNEQKFLQEFPHYDRLTFRFEKESLQQQVAYLLDHKEAALEIGVEVAEAYKAKHPRVASVTKILEYASLVRLDNLRQRPTGSQDFFMWPPARL
ncbi:MAG TPA: hypothetical protein VMR02_17670 [Terracidiphilus sp.]|nr:hypothetical protein [Terracidiphilus sp.]